MASKKTSKTGKRTIDAQDTSNPGENSGLTGTPNVPTTVGRAPLPGQVVEPKLAIPFERRRTPRKLTTGGAMAVFTEGAGAGTLSRVELIDTSFHGLCIKSPVKVNLGTNVSIIPDSPATPRQVGVVVRCDLDDAGFVLGMQSRLAKAAA